MHKIKIFLVAGLVWVISSSFMFQPAEPPESTPHDDIWDVLLDIDWGWMYHKEYKQKVRIPKFNEKARALEGQEITISGYVVPVGYYGDADYIILSAYPVSACFFCGGAGPESVIEVYPKRMKKLFHPNTKYSFRGKLKLNRQVDEHLIYILKDAVRK